MVTMLPTQQTALQALAQAPVPQVDQQRKQQMGDAWKAFRGELQDPLKVSANQPNDNVKTNRCAPIVYKGVSFLFGQTLRIECRGSAVEGSAEPRIQTFVDGLWGDDDDKMTLLSQAGINGGVCGQAFLKLIPAQAQMKYPRIVVLDPMLIRIVTAPDDCSLTLAYLIEYPGVNDIQKRQIISRTDPGILAGIAGEYDLDDTWTITNYERRGQAGLWYQASESDIWPWPFAPIFTNQNLPNPNEAWGMPDLSQDIIEINRVLNFIQSNTSRILKFHAHPKTWGKGFKAAQIQTGVDDVLIIESMDGTLQNLEMHSDLASSLQFISMLRDSMDEQSRVPAVALGRMENMVRGEISGVALQLLFQPLIEKTVQKQRLYGKTIREICRAALVIAGLLPLEQYEDYTVNLHWQELLPIDDLQAAQTALTYQQVGVSQATILAKLGFDAEDEAEKSANEQEKKTAGQSVPLTPQMPGGSAQ